MFHFVLRISKIMLSLILIFSFTIL